MDVTKLSDKELAALRSDIDQEIENRKELRRQEAIGKLRGVAQKAGFTLEELVFDRKGRLQIPPEVKYRDPANPSNTWGGRGRKPNWLVSALKRGRTLDEFAV